MIETLFFRKYDGSGETGAGEILDELGNFTICRSYSSERYQLVYNFDNKNYSNIEGHVWLYEHPELQNIYNLRSVCQESVNPEVTASNLQFFINTGFVQTVTEMVSPYFSVGSKALTEQDFLFEEKTFWIPFILLALPAKNYFEPENNILFYAIKEFCKKASRDLQFGGKAFIENDGLVKQSLYNTRNAIINALDTSDYPEQQKEVVFSLMLEKLESNSDIKVAELEKTKKLAVLATN